MITPPMVSGARRSASMLSSIAASFDGCADASRSAGEVADQRLGDRGDRGEGERHDEPEPMVPVVASAQHARPRTPRRRRSRRP